MSRSPKLKPVFCGLLLLLTVCAGAALAGGLLEDTSRNMALDDMASALAAKERGDLAGAIKRFSHALNHGNLDNENRAIAYNNRGNCHADLGDRQKAMTDYNMALAADPNFTEAYFNRASLYYAQKQYQEALKDYQKAAAINPGLAQAHYNMSFAYAQLGRLPEAVKAAQDAITLSPDNKRYREQLAVWQEMAGQK